MHNRTVSRVSLGFSRQTAWLLGLALFLAPGLRAAEIHLHNGFVMEGKPVPFRR